jgi:hypothetical protein
MKYRNACDDPNNWKCDLCNTYNTSDLKTCKSCAQKPYIGKHILEEVVYI